MRIIRYLLLQKNDFLLSAEPQLFTNRMSMNIQEKIDIITKIVEGYSDKYKYVEINPSSVDCIYDLYYVIINSTPETLTRDILRYPKPMPALSHLPIVCLYIGFFCETIFHSDLGKKVSNCYYKLAIEGGNKHAINNLADNYYDLGNFDKALQYYKFYLKNLKSKSGIFSMIATCYSKKKDYVRSLKYYKIQFSMLHDLRRTGLQVKSKLGGVYSNIVIIYERLGKKSEICEYFRMIREDEIKIYDFGIFHFNLAWYESKYGDDRKAINAYELALIYNFANPGEVYDKLARLYHKRKEYDSALKYYKKMLENGREETLSELCIIHSLKRDNLKSLKYFKKCIEFKLDISECKFDQIFRANKNYDSLIHFYVNKQRSIKILELLNSISIKDISIETVETIGNYFSTNVNDDDNGLHAFMRNMIKSKIDLLEIHFKYAVDSAGYNEAKTDFYRTVAEKQ